LDGLTLHRGTKKVESIELDEVIALSPTAEISAIPDYVAVIFKLKETTSKSLKLMH